MTKLATPEFKKVLQEKIKKDRKKSKQFLESVSSYY